MADSNSSPSIFSSEEETKFNKMPNAQEQGLMPEENSPVSNDSAIDRKEIDCKIELGQKRPLPVLKCQASTSSAHQNEPNTENCDFLQKHQMDESGLFKRPRCKDPKPSCSTTTSPEQNLQVLQNNNELLKIKLAMLESLRDQICELRRGGASTSSDTSLN